MENKNRLGLSLALGALLVVGLFSLLQGASNSARADPARLFVDPAGVGLDCSQAQPCALVTALTQAGDGDSLYLATGSYTGTGAAVITLTQAISLYGGWDGVPEGPILRDPAVYPTTLDGQGLRRGVTISGFITCTLDGLIVTGGDASGLGGDEWGHDAGGGLYLRNASVTLRNSQVFSNTARRGGGLYLYTSPATLDGNWIFSNTGELGGGGLFLFNSVATLSGNTVAANFGGGDGGGAYLSYADGATLVENIWSDNLAGAHGGGLYATHSDFHFDRNVVAENTSQMRGGGLGLYTSNAQLDANTVISNTADEWGGGMFIYGGSLGLMNNLVADNWAGEAGSGLYFWRSTARTLHNTIARNRGGDGSGVCVSHWGSTYSNISLLNTILVSHTLGITVSAGDIGRLDGTLWGSGPWANEQDWAGAGTILTGTVNLWGDPLFVDPAGRDYHIGAGSAAIDAGINNEVAHDVDGEPRPNDGDDNGSVGFDIGADEFWPPTLNLLPLVLKSG